MTDALETRLAASLLAALIAIPSSAALAQNHDFSAECQNAANSGGQMWYMYNPNNAQSNATYYRSGSTLCEAGGTDVLVLTSQVPHAMRDVHATAATSGVIQHWTCADQAYGRCSRDDSWDGHLGPNRGSVQLSWFRGGRPASVHSYEWAVGDYVAWTVNISQ